jgi:DNA-binding PadR family transcriptional regulator
VRRGGARLLILRVLAAGPSHGYTIARDIAKMFENAYEPSPGVIYPTLQWLEDVGYVHGSRVAGRVEYAITSSGRSFLRAHEKELALTLEAFQAVRQDRSRPIARSAARLQRTILIYLPELSLEDRVKVAKILDDARARVTRLAEKP